MSSAQPMSYWAASFTPTGTRARADELLRHGRAGRPTAATAQRWYSYQPDLTDYILKTP